ncbi:MAG TPA: OsmC family protein [Acidimicrobiia bacterium]|nr:OsmC family protein [Acidimicrobiia bacterium]
MPAPRTATARWDGSIGDGKGTMAFGSGAYEGEYSATSRFEDDPGTNPEELIAAAHAGCFSMALAAALTRAGTPPTRIDTKAKVHLEKVEDAWTITKIELDTEGEVPGIDQKAFLEAAEGAKKGCPVSRALAGVAEVKLNATHVA